MDLKQRLGGRFSAIFCCFFLAYLQYAASSAAKTDEKTSHQCAIQTMRIASKKLWLILDSATSSKFIPKPNKYCTHYSHTAYGKHCRLHAHEAQQKVCEKRRKKQADVH